MCLFCSLKCGKSGIRSDDRLVVIVIAEDIGELSKCCIVVADGGCTNVGA